MKLARNVAFLLSIASASMIAVACGGSVEHSPQTSASAATKAPVHIEGRGPIKLVGDALGEVPLRADQRAQIETLATEADRRQARIANGRKELVRMFADQFEKGAIDKETLTAKLAELDAELAKVRAEDREAIVKLHGILDADQRNAFVDELEELFKERRRELSGHAKGAKRAKGTGRGFFKLKTLADDLKLTDEQKTQIREALREARKSTHGELKLKEERPDGQAAQDEAPSTPPPQERRKGWKKRTSASHHAAAGKHKGRRIGRKALNEFRKDKLDPDAVVLPGSAKSARPFDAARMGAVAEKILPILSAEQRKIAAQKLRDMAAKDDATRLLR